MSTACPIDPTNAINKLKIENENINFLMNDIKNSGLLETCPVLPDMTGGKRRKSKSKSKEVRKMVHIEKSKSKSKDYPNLKKAVKKLNNYLATSKRDQEARLKFVLFLPSKNLY